VQRVEVQLKQIDGELAVAVRFVNWFTDRGSTYEHNLQAVERHLKTLVAPAAIQHRIRIAQVRSDKLQERGSS
jgi:hypothetical protein